MLNDKTKDKKMLMNKAQKAMLLNDIQVNGLITVSEECNVGKNKNFNRCNKEQKLLQNILPFSDYSVNVVHTKGMESTVKMIEKQLQMANARGLKSDRNGTVFLYEYIDEKALEYGHFAPLTKIMNHLYSPSLKTGSKGLKKLISQSIIKGSIGEIGLNVAELFGVERLTGAAERTKEHEIWHLIDYLCDATGIRNDSPVNTTGDGQQRMMENLQTELGQQANYSLGMIYRSIDASLEDFRNYVNYGSEWFVHQQMCITRGLTPGTIEGYQFSHGLVQQVMNALNVLVKAKEIKKSMARNVMAKYILGQFTTYKPQLIQSIKTSEYAWMLKRF